MFREKYPVMENFAVGYNSSMDRIYGHTCPNNVVMVLPDGPKADRK